MIKKTHLIKIPFSRSNKIKKDQRLGWIWYCLTNQSPNGNLPLSVFSWFSNPDLLLLQPRAHLIGKICCQFIRVDYASLPSFHDVHCTKQNLKSHSTAFHGWLHCEFRGASFFPARFLTSSRSCGHPINDSAPPGKSHFVDEQSSNFLFKSSAFFDDDVFWKVLEFLRVPVPSCLRLWHFFASLLRGALLTVLERSCRQRDADRSA